MTGLVAFFGCSESAPPRGPSNSGHTAAGPIKATEPLGWLGLAPSPAPDDASPGFLPTDAQHPLVAVDGTRLARSLLAIDTRGTIARFTAGAGTKIRHGCDGHELDVTPFIGPRLAPGVVWLLPPGMPASWHPTPLAIVARSTTPARRDYAIGPLVIELARTAKLRGSLVISRAGTRIHAAPIERQLMDGADDAPIDLAEGGPAIPEPVAAWSITGDAILVVLHEPSYEGDSLRAVLVETSSARALDDMQLYLYRCAF